jgi:DNA-binding MarR family transcriptional regulator
MSNMRSKKGKSPPARRVSWLDVDRRTRDYSFHDYMRIVAHARYVFRRVQRIIDECARGHGVEPLEHQAMIQIYGAAEQRLPIGRLAERLDIVSALASRLVQQLEGRALVRRTRSASDRRATFVSLTPKGLDMLRSVVEDLHSEVEYFRLKSNAEERKATHEITAFYVGSLGVKGSDSSSRKARGRAASPARRARGARRRT